MISIEESQQLMDEFLLLRKIYAETKAPEDFKKFRAHEQVCIQKFEYLMPV